MTLSIAQTMNNSQFENKENLRNAARNILNRQGASQEATEKLLQNVFGSNSDVISKNVGLAILSASNQVTVSNSLKETLKYLKAQSSNKEHKKPVLGELWNSFNEEYSNEDYTGELYDFEIDKSIKNIFIAA